MLRGFVYFFIFSALASAILFPIYFQPQKPIPLANSYESESAYYSLLSFKRAMSSSAAHVASNLAPHSALLSASCQRIQSSCLPASATEQEIAAASTIFAWSGLQSAQNSQNSNFKIEIACGVSQDSAPGVAPCANLISFHPRQSSSMSGVLRSDYFQGGASGKIWVAATSKISGSRYWSFFPNMFEFSEGVVP